ncbi:MAG TPA: hypothetical protein VEB22_05115 [Phycisphaerales bacterium]|nr:hypothetical protein [Phycisphaerales bacterium]
MACGYDMMGGGKVKTKLGEEVVAPGPEPVVREKGMTQKAATITGIVLVASALLAAGWNTKPETPFGVRLERCLLVVIESATSVGTGLVAVWFAAWLQQRPFGRVDLGAARLLACIGAFLLVFNLRIPIGTDNGFFLMLSVLAKLAAAVGVYLLTVHLLIGRDRKTTGTIALAHAGATLVIFLQTWLWSGTFNSVEW